MPIISEIKVIDNEVWCKVKLARNTDVCGTISLYTPDEIEEIKKESIKNFLLHQFKNYWGS